MRTVSRQGLTNWHLNCQVDKESFYNILVPSCAATVLFIQWCWSSHLIPSRKRIDCSSRVTHNTWLEVLGSWEGAVPRSLRKLLRSLKRCIIKGMLSNSCLGTWDNCLQISWQIEGDSVLHNFTWIYGGNADNVYQLCNSCFSEENLALLPHAREKFPINTV